MPDIHLPIGTSSVHRLMACPASLSRSKLAPDSGSSGAADEGTLLHTVMENIYQHDMSAVEQVGKTTYKDLVFTNEMLVDQIVPAIAATEKLLDMVDADELILEQFVQLIPAVAGGTLDMIAVSSDEKTILLNDYKFGYNGVDVENNKQILMAAASAATDPITKAVFAKAERFIGAITQPKVHGDTSPTWEFNKGHLAEFSINLGSAIAEADRDIPLAKSGDHCKYCRAAPFCDEKKLAARSALLLDKTQETDLVEALAIVDEVEAWAKDVKKTAHKLLEQGAEINGWKLVQKRATRRWADPAAVEDKIRKAKKIKLEQGFKMELKSPPQIEKLCKEIGYPFDRFSDLVASVSSGTTLAPESDKRPAVGKQVIPDNLLELVAKS